ncbi:DUF6804 family protein [Clostridium sp.]|uniref:DUF6804 family protein n=1 Tax=Clostridium sp. TaxID=1506 RepID=UPI002851EA72|nr:DUF6804 family protein [Clostridium sp.]MDR3593829.1 hypothetical protein [Clostridium sp.]
MNKLFDTLLKLGIIALLIISATTKQQYLYFNFVRWTVFIASIYFAYKSRQTGIVAVIFFCAFSILFNPFIPFSFRKEIWRLIDLIVSVLIAMTIDWGKYKESLSPRGKLVYNLIRNCFWGVVALVAVFWFIYSIIGNPYNEYLLITQGITTNGFIIYSEEHEDVAEQEGRSAVQVYDVYYEYTFTTQDGKIIKSHASDRNSEPGYLHDANEKPIPIEVEYIPLNPEINRVKNMTNQCHTIAEFFWRKVGLGTLLLLIFLSYGFALIRGAIKKYLTESKKLNTNIR